MIDQLSALFELGDRAPAIHYTYLPPTPQVVPNVALKKAHVNSSFYLTVIGLENRSAKTLKTLLIKLPLLPDYQPLVEFSNDSKRQWSYVPDGPYITIDSLDPGAAAYTTLFLHQHEVPSFREPQVLVDGRLLSRAMRTAGFAKAQPRMALALSGAFLALFMSVGLLAYTIWISTPLDPKRRAIEAATAGWTGCTVNAYAKAEANPSVLQRHKLGEQSLLQMNSVPDRESLKDKDYVVVCE